MCSLSSFSYSPLAIAHFLPHSVAICTLSISYFSPCARVCATARSEFPTQVQFRIMGFRGWLVGVLFTSFSNRLFLCFMFCGGYGCRCGCRVVLLSLSLVHLPLVEFSGVLAIWGSGRVLKGPSFMPHIYLIRYLLDQKLSTFDGFVFLAMLRGDR
jgi:hypothetical protein